MGRVYLCIEDVLKLYQCVGKPLPSPGLAPTVFSACQTHCGTTGRLFVCCTDVEKGGRKVHGKPRRGSVGPQAISGHPFWIIHWVSVGSIPGSSRLHTSKVGSEISVPYLRHCVGFLKRKKKTLILFSPDFTVRWKIFICSEAKQNPKVLVLSESKVKNESTDYLNRHRVMGLGVWNRLPCKQVSG